MKTSEYYKQNIINRCQFCGIKIPVAWKNCDNRECGLARNLYWQRKKLYKKNKRNIINTHSVDASKIKSK